VDNIHFGEIGDLWKHLPLAEILAVERPRRYWQTHDGNAIYELRPSPDRNYGICHFLGNLDRHPPLHETRYVSVVGRNPPAIKAASVVLPLLRPSTIERAWP
jgi:23S rRNA (adenine2030-N6)-methyltransferase